MQVFDVLGAGTAVMTSAVNVKSIGEIQNRRQIGSSSVVGNKLNTAIETTNTFAFAGRADLVNQMSYR
jgi:hypothetical protein